MPAWFLRFLPHGLVVLAIVGAVWWINDAGYDRAMAERDARDAKMLDQMRAELRESEQRLAQSINDLAGDYERQRDGLARAGAAIQPIIIGETNRAPRLADPALGLTPGLLDAVNRARATGPCATTPSGRIECALPTAAASSGSVDR